MVADGRNRGKDPSTRGNGATGFSPLLSAAVSSNAFESTNPPDISERHGEANSHYEVTCSMQFVAICINGHARSILCQYNNLSTTTRADQQAREPAPG